MNRLKNWLVKKLTGHTIDDINSAFNPQKRVVFERVSLEPIVLKAKHYVGGDHMKYPEDYIKAIEKNLAIELAEQAKEYIIYGNDIAYYDNEPLCSYITAQLCIDAVQKGE